MNETMGWTVVHIEEEMRPVDTQKKSKINKRIVVQLSSVFIHIKLNMMFSLTMGAFSITTIYKFT